MAGSTTMLPSAAIAAFAQGRIEGRRLLLLGSATSCLWEKALERGARLVHLCDPDPVRLAQAAAANTLHNVSFAPLSNQASLALRDGVFDVAIIENLSVLDDPVTALRLTRRALAVRGVVFVTAPNPDIRESLLPDFSTPKLLLDYYSLYDVVRAEFPVVRMLGQMPFVGYTMAELAPLDSPEPILDAGFVPGGTEEPEWFVAAASAQPFDIEGFTVVQFPASEVLHHSSERQMREQLRASRSAERNAVERLARLEAQQLDSAAAEVRKEADLAKQLADLKVELKHKEERMALLEARATAVEASSVEARNRLEQMQQQPAADTASDVLRLENQLRERGARLRELEAQLKSAELVGRQLLRDLEAARNSQTQRFGTEAWSSTVAMRIQAEPAATDTAQSPEKTSAWVSRKVDADTSPAGNGPCSESDLELLVHERARMQADIQAATWRIDQLLSELTKHKGAEVELAQAKNQLSYAESRLSEQSALLRQLESDAIRG